MMTLPKNKKELRLLFFNSVKMVSIYKTNVTNKRTASCILMLLKNESRIINANFDLEDIDKILRIVSNYSLSVEVIAIVNTFGFLCEELE